MALTFDEICIAPCRHRSGRAELDGARRPRGEWILRVGGGTNRRGAW